MAERRQRATGLSAEDGRCFLDPEPQVTDGARFPEACEEGKDEVGRVE